MGPSDEIQPKAWPLARRAARAETRHHARLPAGHRAGLCFIGSWGADIASRLRSIGHVGSWPHRNASNRVDGFDPRDVERDLRRQLSLIDHRVPRHIEVRVREIARTITDVLPRAAELGPASRDLFVLQRTADDYLPTALEAYLNLPGGALVAGGRSEEHTSELQSPVHLV